jgi:hypothetical protein
MVSQVFRAPWSPTSSLSWAARKRSALVAYGNPRNVPPGAQSVAVREVRQGGTNLNFERAPVDLLHHLSVERTLTLGE